jgi:hypothetical protein
VVEKADDVAEVEENRFHVPIVGGGDVGFS